VVPPSEQKASGAVGCSVSNEIGGKIRPLGKIRNGCRNRSGKTIISASFNHLTSSQVELIDGSKAA